mmetsp:Transcript_30666/g.85903  ORF Transcript_30666/g.85903 Transcript_30666/m.85903 type:complete len:563 (+) Transcript_30666:81-1769(+)
MTVFAVVLIVCSALSGFALLCLKALDVENWIPFPLACLVWGSEATRLALNLCDSVLLFLVPQVKKPSIPPPLARKLWNESAAHLPTVDVLILCAGEAPELVVATAVAARGMHYAPGQVVVTVCDDAADEVLKGMCAKAGVGYLGRDNAPTHYKSGNIAHALSKTGGELVLLLDSDMCCHADALLQLVPYFLSPTGRGLGFVQTPQDFRNVLAGDPLLRDKVFYYEDQCQRMQQAGLPLFLGTNAIFRREALQISAGSWCLTEDTLLSIQLMGVREGRFHPTPCATGIAAPTLFDTYRQRVRWSSGAVQLLSLVRWRALWRRVGLTRCLLILRIAVHPLMAVHTHLCAMLTLLLLVLPAYRPSMRVDCRWVIVTQLLGYLQSIYVYYRHRNLLVSSFRSTIVLSSPNLVGLLRGIKYLWDPSTPLPFNITSKVMRGPNRVIDAHFLGWLPLLGIVITSAAASGFHLIRWACGIPPSSQVCAGMIENSVWLLAYCEFLPLLVPGRLDQLQREAERKNATSRKFRNNSHAEPEHTGWSAVSHAVCMVGLQVLSYIFLHRCLLLPA